MQTAYIALGGNLGDVRASFDSACTMLTKACVIVGKSKLYLTPALVSPHDAEPQPDYLNAVLHIQTMLKAEQLLEHLHHIENEHGRKRTKHWGPRTLDLDLLAYENMVQTETALTLPHPRLHERMFVLQPFADIQPHWQHPLLHKSVATMIQGLTHLNDTCYEGIVWTNQRTR